MAKITLYHDQSAAVTCVPNIFIDQYMICQTGKGKIRRGLRKTAEQVQIDFNVLSVGAGHVLINKNIRHAGCCRRHLSGGRASAGQTLKQSGHSQSAFATCS